MQNRVVDIDSLRSFVLPLDMQDSHALMVQREDELRRQISELSVAHLKALEEQESKSSEAFNDMEEALNGIDYVNHIVYLLYLLSRDNQ